MGRGEGFPWSVLQVGRGQKAENRIKSRWWRVHSTWQHPVRHYTCSIQIPAVHRTGSDDGQLGLIFLVNLFFGWSLISWLVCLVWAIDGLSLFGNTQQVVIVQQSVTTTDPDAATTKTVVSSNTISERKN